MAKSKLGSDPELFVVKRGAGVPAYYALGGDVDLRLPFGTAVCDGMAVEFTVDPTDSPLLITGRIGHNLTAVKNFITARDPTYVMSLIPNISVDATHVAVMGAEFGRGSLQVFGCNPDDRVYDLPLIKRPSPESYFFRTSGGHIHMQVDELAAWKPGYSFMIAMLDSVLGATSTFISQSAEAKERKKLYGKAGYYRTNSKLGTVEYRPLTGQALIQNGDVASSMFAAAQAVADFCVDLYASSTRDDYIKTMQRILGSNDLRNAVALMIDTHDIAGCRRHVERVAKSYPSTVALAAAKLASLSPLTSFGIDWDSYESYKHMASVDVRAAAGVTV